jgi:hypothetical protein
LKNEQGESGMMTHTPGPWFYDEWTENIGFAGGWLAVVADEYREGNERLGSKVDDANLIAAAPDLLEACEKAVETIDDDAPGAGLTERGLLRLLRAAIAKAKGR